MNEFNGVAPTVVGAVQFQMTSDGKIQASATVADPLMAFHMIGQGTALLAAEFKKQSAQKIQLAQADLLRHLPN